MSSFEEVEGHEDGEEVHVRRVELEVDAGGTDVVAGGHHSDHDQGEPHRVEHAVVKGYPSVSYLNLISLFNFEELLHPDHFDEEKTKDGVGYVAQEMVPHDQRTSRLQTLKVVETTILITILPGQNVMLASQFVLSNDRN